ncbi:ABC transporter substrate-binding protein [Ottowia thiooxydans]|uniref:Branched-chain amino acid transport system substrate-binding protein n=1 Tax=Ottowia thiooxydans TaxID=219182 RepID=A0ABV2Q8R4_9BURK
MSNFHFSRRDALKTLAATSGSIISGATWAQSAQGDLNIAVLSQFSGNYATLGPSILRGAQLIVEERGGKVLGRKINLLQRDDEGKPAVGVRRITELVENEGVRYFTGNASSAVGLAEAEIAARSKVVQFAGGGSDEFTGARCNDFTFQWSAHPYTACSATLEYIRKLHPNAKRIYTLTADYAFGHSLLKYTQALAPGLGFEMIAGDRHPANERQFTQYFNKAFAAKPDVVLLLTAGADFLAAARQLHSFGAKNLVVGAPWAAEIDDLKELTPNMRAWLILGLNYHAGIDNPVNKSFVVSAVKKYKSVPTYPMAMGYDTFRTLFLAMEKANSVDPKVVAKTLEGWRFDSVHGSTQIDAKTHQSLRPYYLARCKAASEMKNADDIAEIVYQGNKPQPAELNDCKRA